MRRYVMFLVCVVAALFVLSLAFAVDHHEKDELLKVFDAGVKAINAKDMSTFASLHLQDETTVHINVMEGGVFKGWAAGKKNFEDFMASGAMLTNMQNVSLKVVGNSAWGVWTAVNEMTMDGKKMTNPFRLTLVFERVGDKWLVSHSHSSAGLPPPPPAKM